MSGCIYDGQPAVARDLCHGRLPICPDHVGHQLELLPVKAEAAVAPATPPESAPDPTRRARRAETKE